MSLGNNIKKYRKELGLTQEELAGILCVTSQAVSKWESEAGLPDTAQIVPLARALNVSTDALFGFGRESYDMAAAEKILKEADTLRDSGSQMEGALKAADFLDGKCEEDIFNYRVLMRYVQSVAHLSRFVSYNGLFAEDEAIWQKYVKAAVNRGTQVIRYSGEKELIEKCHYALAWIYWHKQDFTKGREHIAALPSIANNMLQETINSYYCSAESAKEGEWLRFETWRDSVRDNFQNFIRAINKQFVYTAETSMWSCPFEETERHCLWALSVMDRFMNRKEMIAHCQGFYRETVKYLVAAYLRNGKPEQATDLWKNLMQKIDEYVRFCDEEVAAVKGQKALLIKKFGEKSANNMEGYTREWIDSKLQFILNQLKSWCDDVVWFKFEKLRLS